MGSVINCIVVDDEQPARRLLEGYINRTDGLHLGGSFKHPVQAIEHLRKPGTDLILLDIEMPDLKGTDLLKTLPNPPMVIFTTAYKEYAVDGFDLNAVDYLLKPISYDRFLKGISKASRLMHNSGTNVSSQSSEFLAIKSDGRTHRILYENILYIENQREYVRFHTISGKKVMVLYTLRELAEQLPQDHFVRCHKSFIVNINMVDSMYGNQLEIGKDIIPIGKSFKDQVMHKVFGKEL